MGTPPPPAVVDAVVGAPVPKIQKGKDRIWRNQASVGNKPAEKEILAISPSTDAIIRSPYTVSTPLGELNVKPAG
jgi:hypothetical protein